MMKMRANYAFLAAAVVVVIATSIPRGKTEAPAHTEPPRIVATAPRAPSECLVLESKSADGSPGIMIVHGVIRNDCGRAFRYVV
jgi:hypothetical protein